MTNIRLMNVGVVTVTTRHGTRQEHADCVEIKADPDCCSITVYDIYRGPVNNQRVEPKIKAKIVIPRPVTIIDPADLMRGGNGSEWFVSSDDGDVCVVIAPRYDGEHIWLDQSFGRSLSPLLRDLYIRRRMSISLVTIHERWRAGSEDPEMRKIHSANVIKSRRFISRLERQIADLEANGTRSTGSHRDP